MNLEPKPDERDIDSPNYLNPEETPIPPSQAPEVFARLAASPDYEYEDNYAEELDYSEYSQGWEAGYKAGRISVYGFRLWRFARRLKWKWHDLRRAIRRVPSDNSDIPF